MPGVKHPTAPGFFILMELNQEAIQSLSLSDLFTILNEEENLKMLIYFKLPELHDWEVDSVWASMQIAVQKEINRRLDNVFIF